ncbi:type II secretion system protein GspJ [Pseudoruegeria sp. HB172150]|uniref:type II secretion system protein GspJ n=1 Tax=Pseudoruegeria sp. HB172150 TaxID=2721164 RepID=UPI0015518313|nr:type II secretion system protein GspJ [Pseudoruegeria sp. HB172150]
MSAARDKAVTEPGGQILSRRRDRGFSLLELTVVLAVFAGVALIGAQVIAQTLRADRQLAARDAETADLSYGLALLRHDLNSAIALPFLPPDGPARPALDVTAGEQRFDLSLGGQPRFDASGPATARAVWRLDKQSGTITRQLWTSLAPVNMLAAGPELVIFNQVHALMFETYDTGSGWTGGFPNPEKNALALPAAIRVTLEHETLDQLQTLVSLR